MRGRGSRYETAPFQDRGVALQVGFQKLEVEFGGVWGAGMDGLTAGGKREGGGGSCLRQSVA